MENPDKTENGESPASKSLLYLLLAGGGLAGVAAVITALFDPIQLAVNELSKEPLPNYAPEAVIEIDQPSAANTNNTIEVFDGSTVKLNSYRSRDSEDGNDLMPIWSIDGKEAHTGDVYTTTLSKRDTVYNIALTVTDKGGKKGKSSVSVKVVDPEIPEEISVISSRSPQYSETIADHESPVSSVQSPSVSSGRSIGDYLKLLRNLISPSRESSRNNTNHLDWFYITQGEKLPENTFIAGNEYFSELQESQPLYLCRAEYGGYKLPGKVVSGKCNIPLYEIVNGEVENRKEKVLAQYEVLIPQISLRWIDHELVSRNSNGIPIHAVFSDERYSSVICRAEYAERGNSGQHPGILDVKMDRCMFPWGGVVGYLSDYEVLVTSQ